MTTVGTLATDVEADLLAAELESAGIKCLVLDDNSYGGNLIGMTSTHGIRVQVEDDEVESARLIAAKRSHAEPPSSTKAKATVSRWTALTWFKGLLFADLVLSLLFWMVPETWPVAIPERVLKELGDDAATIAPIGPAILASLAWPLYLLRFAALFALCFRARFGRWLYVVAVIGGWISGLAVGIALSPRVTGFMDGGQWIITGALIALMFSPEVRKWFAKDPPSNEG